MEISTMREAYKFAILTIRMLDTQLQRILAKSGDQTNKMDE